MLAQYVRKWRDNHFDRTRSTAVNHSLGTRGVDCRKPFKMYSFATYALNLIA